MKQLYSRYQRNRELVSMGAYVAGADPELDAALKSWPAIQSYLRQEATEGVSLDKSVQALLALATRSPQ